MTFKTFSVIKKGAAMPKIFSEDDKEKLRTMLIETGFEILRSSGLDGVNVDELCRKCYIAKGTFYNFFETKAEYIYQMMLFERERSKRELSSRLNENGRLTSSALRSYLIWLRDENPNVFSYLTDKEQKMLISKWRPEYLENRQNDEQTMQAIISLLERPAPQPDWKNACNLMKMLAIALTMPEVFIADAFESTTEILIDKIVECLT